MAGRLCVSIAGLVEPIRSPTDLLQSKFNSHVSTPNHFVFAFDSSERAGIPGWGILVDDSWQRTLGSAC